MDLEQKTLRVGAAAILIALTLRLLSGGLLQSAVQLLTKPETAGFLLYLETGRIVRSIPDGTVETEPATTPSEPAQETTEPPPVSVEAVQAVFAPEDMERVSVNPLCDRTADVSALLRQPLSWDLTGPEPTVLILHTHASESYDNTEGYVESDAYRTLDAGYNMVSVGAYLAELLTQQGLSVLHDRTLHDGDSYNDAYQNARQTISSYLQQYPSIRLVLDLHRDAMEDSNGNQLGDTVLSGEQQIARLMLVVGTDAGGLAHPNWQENMALAVKLHAGLEKLCPGICRPVSFRSQRFNQDLSTGAILIEVGAAGNTRQEALGAAEVLAEGIAAMTYGAVFTEDSTS